MRNENDKTLKGTFVALVAILSAIVAFVTLAIKKGRLKELLISTPILFLGYWLDFSLENIYSQHLNVIGILIMYALPLGIYAIYWYFLFQQEKITSIRANRNWANRDWWWALDGWEFEEEVAEVFRLNGFKAKVTKKTGDGGIDIVMHKDGLKYIVQCKHYRKEVSVEAVRELNGLKNDFQADILYFIASSGLTKAGYEFISNKPYYFVFTLEDIIAMGLRPSEKEDEDVIDVSCEEITEVKQFPSLRKLL